MFYHRVLPPTSALSATSTTIYPAPRPDSLLQHKIMTSEASSGQVRKTVVQPPSRKTVALTTRNRRPSPDLETGQEYPDSNTSAPSSGLSTRKRSSSQISVEELRHSGRGFPSLSTSSGVSRLTDSPKDVCLCQADPKVPRPRNAFILYRQHNQASVVAQHPGLANPEISKIIGDQWRNSSLETKTHWKLLAEEEKLRHQRQYPDYRYQPRRAGRGSDPSISSSGGSGGSPTPTRCIKCGGKSITAPSMIVPVPSTPVTPYTASLPPQAPSSASSAGRFLRQMTSPPVPQSAGFRPRPALSNGPLHSSIVRDSRHEELESPLSPDGKRRRFANGHYVPVRSGNGQLTPFPFTGRRESLPRPDFMSKGRFSMAAPPRPHRTNSISHDNSLTLPPLKIGSVSDSSTQAKSVEAMIMSIPPINKIKVLAKISPPLGNPSPASPAHAIRGAVIAIDGSDDEAVKTVVASLSDFLSKDNEHKIRVWDSPALSNSPEKTFADYLQLITRWHGLSNEVTAYITTIPFPLSPTPVSPKTVTQPSERRSSPDPSDRNDQSTKTSSPPPADSSSINTPKQTPTHSISTPPPLPITLLPHYQLSLTNTFASSIPITDAYAPIDHWQWLATLWRGVVGPDITIVVQSPSNGVQNGQGGDGDGIQERETERERSPREGGVEVRLGDARALVVRGCGEKELRRVGFEVGEWVRGIGEGRGRGGN